MLLEEEPSVDNNSFFAKTKRLILGLSLSVLVVMLILMLIPNDAEQNFYNIITGKSSLHAGKVGTEDISEEYFQASRRICSNMFKSDRQTEENIINCAFETAKRFKISRIVSEAVGFNISEQKIKADIWEQAKMTHKETAVGAGYSEEEKLSAEEIYKNNLLSIPMSFRKDMILADYVMERFLLSSPEPSEDEKKIKSEMKGLKLSLRYAFFSETEYLNSINDLPVSDDEVKKDYEESVKSGNLKNAKGETPSLDERKQLIVNKLRSEKKQQKLTEMKANLQKLKSSDKTTLAEIASLAGSKIQEVKDLPISELNRMTEKPNSQPWKFVTKAAFQKDLTEIPFGQGKIGGPYQEGDKQVFVEFSSMKIEEIKDKVADDNSKNIEKYKAYTFIGEAVQSISSVYPVYRNIKFQK